MKSFEAKITPKGKSGFTIRIQAKDSFDAKKALAAQYPGSSVSMFKEV
jgi:hypothetical protein